MKKNWSGPTQSVITDYGHNPAGQFRGMKADIWEGGHRVPFIAKWTGNIKEGTQTTALVSSMDLMPTIAEIIGFELPENASEDGESMFDILKGNENSGREILVNHSGGGVFALRKGDWKLILSDRSGGFSDHKNPDGYGIETLGQLYNLADDLGEKDNLYSKYPDMVKELTNELEKIKSN